MELSVENMLRLFGDDFKVISGAAGINRIIKSVTVMEEPDFHKRIKGGEFIISNAYFLRKNVDLLYDLLEILDQNNAAAIGIKVNRYIHKIPDKVIEKAEELDFPLIFIPNNYTFSDVIDTVLEEIINKKVKTLSFSEKTNKIFRDLLRKNKNFFQILDMLAGMLEREIAFYDNIFDVYYSNYNDDLDNVEIEKILEDKFSYEIKNNSSVYGYIIFCDQKADIEISDFEKIVLENAATILEFKIQKEISNYKIERKYKDEFVQSLIFNNFKSWKEIYEGIKFYDLSFTGNLFCFICESEIFEGEENDDFFMKNVINKKIENLFSEYIYTRIKNELIFIVNSELDLSDETIKTELQNKFLKNIKSPKPIKVGIGRNKKEIKEINYSYEEAKKALKIGRNIDDEKDIYFFSELGIYRLLDSISDQEVAQNFIKESLGELRNDEELLNTLQAIVEKDWNLKEASKELFVHYNTVIYRFNKILKILDFDSNDAEKKLNIAVSLKLYNMLN